MTRRIVVSLAAGAVLGMGCLTQMDIAQAGMFDMMNPSKWFNSNDRDRYYGGYGPYGYGGGPYGYGGPWGYGGGPWGYGGGPWGYGGYRQPQTIVVTPGGGSEKGPPPPRLPE